MNCIKIFHYIMGLFIHSFLFSILKIGVSCKDDGKKLFKDYGLSVNGCVDLRHILRRIRGYQWYGLLN